MVKIGNLEVYGIIYKITNKVNGKVYIGQTTRENGFKGRYMCKGEGIERVYNYHNKNINRNSSSCNFHLLKSIKKYGFENFEVCEIFDFAFSRTELDLKEKIYIKLFDCINNGYNTQEGGHDCCILKGKDVVTNKYSEEQIGEIKELYVSGYTNKEIQEITNITRETISAVVNLRTWVYVREDLNDVLKEIKNERYKNLNLDIYKFKDEIRILYNNGKNIYEIINILFSEYTLSDNKIKEIKSLLRRFKYEDLGLVRYCTKCNKEFTINMGDKYHNKRKYCYKCSPKKINTNKSKTNYKKSNKIKVKHGNIYKTKLLIKKENSICELYIKYKTFKDVKDKLDFEGFSINNDDIKYILNKNNIKLFDTRKVENNLSYIKIVKDNNIIKIFEYKFECVEWMIDNKMFFDKKTAKNRLNYIIDKNVDILGYYFYKSNKEEFEYYNKL